MLDNLSVSVTVGDSVTVSVDALSVTVTTPPIVVVEVIVSSSVMVLIVESYTVFVITSQTYVRTVSVVGSVVVMVRVIVEVSETVSDSVNRVKSILVDLHLNRWSANRWARGDVWMRLFSCIGNHILTHGC